MSKLTKTILYLSSFFPLFILLIIQNIAIRDEKGILKISVFFDQFLEDGLFSPKSFFWISVLVFLVVSFFSIVSFYKFYIQSVGVEGKLLGENYERADTLGYIVSYIVPLVSMDISSYRSILVNYLLFFIIGIFYIKNNQFFMNPIFNLLGYNILMSDAGTVYITKLSPRRMKEIVREDEAVVLKNIAEDIYVVKEKTN